MSFEQLPRLEDRRILVNRIGRLASSLNSPDPELYAMMYYCAELPKAMPLAHWCHIRNMAAVQFDLVTNVDEANEADIPVLRAVEAELEPQLKHLRGFKEGWQHRSPAFGAALNDVSILQERLYRRDRPSRKVL